jgi:hypothetical protein
MVILGTQEKPEILAWASGLMASDDLSVSKY